MHGLRLRGAGGTNEVLKLLPFSNRYFNGITGFGIIYWLSPRQTRNVLVIACIAAFNHPDSQISLLTGIAHLYLLISSPEFNLDDPILR